MKVTNLSNLRKIKSHQNNELGSAKMIVSLENSIVTMEHGDTGEVLFTGKAQLGDWTKITNCIRSLKEVS